MLPYRSDNVGYVRHGGSRGGSEVEDLAAWGHVDGVHAAQDARGQLATERVPDAVLNLKERRAKGG